MDIRWMMREAVEVTNDSFGHYLGVKVRRQNRSRPATLKAKTMFGQTPVRVLEVGCGRGKNARDILEQLNVSEFVVVDPFEKYAGYNDYSREQLAWGHQQARKRLSRYEGKVTWIRELSRGALERIKGTFDFIYVDGNHEYDFVLADMNAYWKLLKPRAVFGGHDIDQVGVTKAFITFCYENRIPNLEVKDPDWIITVGA